MQGGDGMTGKLVTLPMKTDEYVVVPSGAEISLRRPDFSQCQTTADFLEVKCALMEKIIDIELQIDLFHSGVGVEQGKSYERDWLPRANAALKWAKLYRDECGQRQGLLNERVKMNRQGEICQVFVNIAKLRLSKEDFTAILDAAVAQVNPKSDAGR